MFETPAIVIDGPRLQNNIKDMADYASSHSFELRPHIKAHRLPQIASLQSSAGSRSFTCAKIGEAEMLVANGFNDILIAHQIIGKAKMAKLDQLLSKGDVMVGCDSLDGARQLQELACLRGQPINISIEIDSGLHRCGTAPGQSTVDLIEAILRECDYLRLKGLFTHAGQAYAANSYEQLKDIALAEGNSVVETAAMLAKRGIRLDYISVGSTPTAKFAHKSPGVNEIRPGNYVFYDAIQVGLGVAQVDSCALTVRATVVSKPNSGQVVIDAGSKVLGLDKGAHGIELVRGFGIILGWPDLTLERLSEEHGVIRTDGRGRLPDIGEQLSIIPNHACPVLYRADKVFVEGLSHEPILWNGAMRGSL